ncbi:helix-turn-helix transcriptional regulator [Dyadobacter sp. CY347]|uniref:ArsR/SmtB family transcription factor n=1 Tax=Dyadobacter sp. CY347 TaxID=2909336 RepID=UPI001F2B9F71|nr:helix-turn-helix transcriptional regulator [Dyadobacter sp. CY347]MCF2487450.1 ArsR family transcriptional regulator [Dyadobacter sp. CY347]
MNKPILTDEDKVRIIASVYSNPKKLLIATQIHKLKESSADELTRLTGIKANLITMYLKEMEEAGIMKTRRESYYVFYSLTPFGEKIITLFN